MASQSLFHLGCVELHNGRTISGSGRVIRPEHDCFIFASKWWKQSTQSTPHPLPAWFLKGMEEEDEEEE